MSDSLIGAVINGRYEMVQKLGTGGLGIVYKARDRDLDREVAIKVVRSDNLWAASSTPDIFLNEAKIIARLDHPNILTIYDVVRQNDPDHPVFLVTKLAKGGSLHSQIHPPATHAASRPLPIDKVKYLLTQIAAALDYAHSQRVIHLDIKPHNILFSDETGQMALVADFGLARLLQTTTHVFLTGSRGTPSYMPQEQWAGGDAGRYTDVYALGITLYEMLTGEVPKKSQDESGLFVAQLDRPLPPKIKQVIERATLPDAHQRYQSAGELARAFQEAVQGSSVSVPPVSPMPPASSQPGHTPDSAPTALRLPTRRLTDRERLRDALRDLGHFSEGNPNITEQELISYAFKPRGLFAALGYDKQDKNIFQEQYHVGIVLLMVAGHPLAVVEFKRPVFSITDGLEQLERQYIARLHPDVGVLCNGRELWIYRRTGAFLFHPPAFRLVLSQASESDAEAVYNWLGQREDDPSPEEHKRAAPGSGGYPTVAQGSGQAAGGIFYSNPAFSNPLPPYSHYPPFPASGPLWSTVQVAKQVSLKAKVSLWLGILDFFVGATVVGGFSESKGVPGLVWETISACMAVILAIITVVLGHLAKREIRQSNRQMKGIIRAIIGLIFGYLNIVLFLLTLIGELGR